MKARPGVARAAARALVGTLLTGGVLAPLSMVTAGVAHAATTDYRSQWNLDPAFPPCIRFGDPSITAFDCYPDDHAPNPATTFVYGQMVYDNGGQVGNWAGQGPAALAYIAEGGSDPYSANFLQAEPIFGGWYGFFYPKSSGVTSLSVSAQHQAWVFQSSYNGGSTPFAGRGHPSDPTQWESPVVGVGMNYGNATEIPRNVIPSPPDVSQSCGADLTAPPGTGLCTATQNSTLSTQSPAYTWTWADGSMSTSTPVSKSFTTDGTDTNFTGTLVADAGGGWTETENVGSTTAPCFGQGCLSINTTFSPAGDPTDPSSEPQIGQTVTVTSTVTNTAPVEIDNLVPAPLTGDIAAGTANATPSSVASLAPGATTTFTWSPQFTTAGQQSLDMHVDAGIGSTGRTTFGDDQENVTVAAGPVVVNSTTDAGESPTATNGVCDTGATITDGSGNTVAECTLRAAIQTEDAATTPGPITFNIPGSGSQRIAPLAALPPVTVPITIDATTQPGYSAGAPAVVLDGSAQGGGDGLVIQAGPTQVQGLDVVDFSSGAGVAFDGGSGSTLDASVIGFEPGSGSAEADQVGVRVTATQTTIASGVTIGGDYNAAAVSALPSAPANARSILAEGVGILIDSGSSNTVVSGATIGTPQHQNGDGILAAPIDGAAPVGGVSVQGGTFNNSIGIATFGFGTSYDASVSVTGATLTDTLDVFGFSGVNVLSLASDNFVGKDGGGVFALSLPNHALSVIGNTFDGTGLGVIALDSGGAVINNNNMSATGLSVMLGGESLAGAGYSPDSVTNNQLSSNSLGLLADHEDGLVVSGNTERLDSGNVGASGLWISSSRGVTITNNTVTSGGFGATVFDSPAATITGNTFSGGSWGLVALGGTPSSSLFSGLKAATPVPDSPSAVTGTLAKSDGMAGQIASSWQSAEPLDGSGFGSGATSGAATGDTITGNTITDNNAGVLIGGLAGSVVGTPAPGQPNTITGNSQAAVFVFGTDPVSVQGNVMGDNDTSTLTDGTYAPVIDVVPPPAVVPPQVNDSFPSGGGTEIDGTFAGTPSTAYTIDVYTDPTLGCTLSGNSALTTWLGSVPVTTDASGQASWTYTAATAVPLGNQIGATATSAAGSTTEPSTCQTVDIGTDTTTATPAGVTELPVASNSGFNLGDRVTIDPGQPDAETATISGFGSLIFSAPLQNAHASGEPIIDGAAVGDVTVTGPPSAAAGSTYTATASATANPAPTYSLASNPIPPTWLSVNATTGAVSGQVPTGISSFSYAVTATNSKGSSTSTVQTVTVAAAPTTVTVTGPSSAVVGASYVATASADGSPAPTFTLAAGTPTWLSIDSSTGVVSGTVPLSAEPGFTYKVTARNSQGSATSTLQAVAVDAAPTTVTVTGPGSVVVGQTYAATASADGYPAPTFSLAGAPSWLGINPATGALSGTVPAGTTGFTYAVSATNGVGSATSATQSVATLPAPSKPAFTSPASLVVTSGNAIDFTVSTTGYPAPAVTETGTLPAGVTFTANTDGTAVVAGTPTATGLYKLTLKATNASGSASQAFKLTLNQAPAFSSAASLTEQVGADKTIKVTTTGYPVATLSETGLLPDGVTFTAGPRGTAVITGMPAAGTGGSYPVEITATNGVGGPVVHDFTLVVRQAPLFTSASAITTAAGCPLNFEVATSGYPEAKVTESGKLPAGISFTGTSTGTASLTGVPTVSGIYKVTLRASNAAGSLTQALTISVVQAPALSLRSAVSVQSLERRYARWP